MKIAVNKILKTLSARFLLIMIAPIIITQAVVIHSFYSRHWYKMIHRTSSFVSTEISLLVDHVSNNDDCCIKDKSKYFSLDYNCIHKNDLDYQDNNKFINIRNAREEILIFQDVLKRNIPDIKTHILIDKIDKQLVLKIYLNDKILNIWLPLRLFVTSTTKLFIGLVIGITIILVTIAVILLRNQIRSILDLTKTMQHYGAGKDITYFKPSGAREIRSAGFAFLNMKRRIEKYITQRTNMLAMISHDLRTPLTRIKLQAELMDDDELKKDLLYDVQSMENMINSYMDFVKGEGNEEFIKLDILEWLRNIVRKNYLIKDSKNNEKGEEISLNISSNNQNNKNISILLNLNNNQKYITNIKEQSFRRAICNILNNAMQYGDKVSINLTKINNKILISIEDNGPGISDENKKNVFKPFYRGDKSRSLHNNSGVGLGLAIVYEIVKAHKGDIKLTDSKKLGGLKVEISLNIE